MPYIYCITNLINDKKYIGKTMQTIEKRFAEHVKDSKSKSLRTEKRPLYNAMQLYGHDKFVVSTLEICSGEQLSEREQYYIQKYDTYNNGYNATIGGEGVPSLDYKGILECYNKGMLATDIAILFKCSVSGVTKVLKSFNIDSRRNYENSRKRKVYQYDLYNNFITEFESVPDAAEWIILQNISTASRKSVMSHINHNLSGKKKNAYKFIWKLQKDN